MAQVAVVHVRVRRVGVVGEPQRQPDLGCPAACRRCPSSRPAPAAAGCRRCRGSGTGRRARGSCAASCRRCAPSQISVVSTVGQKSMRFMSIRVPLIMNHCISKSRVGDRTGGVEAGDRGEGGGQCGAGRQCRYRSQFEDVEGVVEAERRRVGGAIPARSVIGNERSSASVAGPHRHDQFDAFAGAELDPVGGHRSPGAGRRRWRPGGTRGRRRSPRL